MLYSVPALLIVYAFKSSAGTAGVISSKYRIKVKSVTNNVIFDWQATLKMNQGNTQFAKDILKLFLTQLDEAQNNINQAYLKSDKHELSAHLHKLYGGCCYCIVPRLAIAVKNLEGALKSQEVNAIADLYKIVDQEIKALQNAAIANTLLPDSNSR